MIGFLEIVESSRASASHKALFSTKKKTFLCVNVDAVRDEEACSEPLETPRAAGHATKTTNGQRMFIVTHWP